ncbi:ZIP family metal transporter [Cellulosimicrobium arenosum]|uniref:ZIP family zinc transporter n=1 Tax=Cellulosimicrobium arenosum TaxID=2708133 RepID=A0A927G7S6_9MICO|nr:ZIP family zinc transporter [Cellulosimicrobium arenosum]MBD8078467.1 ZIP family zinc transporter [Cellulosimicrobium arenosum]
MAGFWWGLLASSSLLLGAAVVLWRPPGKRAIGLIMAFGAGVLISAVAYDLVEDASRSASGWVLLAGLAGGALTFFVGDLLIDRMGGNGRKRSTGEQSNGSGGAIALGTVLDGIPESVVLGSTLVGGNGVSVAMLAAVFLSNLPEAMSATSGLVKSGTSRGRLWLLWGGTTAVSAVAAGVGYLALGSASGATVAVVQAFAAGALLTMLVDTMIPEATEFGGPVTGLVTVLGFATAFGLSALN